MKPTVKCPECYSTELYKYGKNTFSGHRFSVNTIITAINLYYALNSTTRAISTYLLDYMNIKVSHVTISKWIKKFDKYFKSISDELTQDVYLGDSDEWHADETVVKVDGQKYYLWIKKIKGFKSFESANSLISNFIFYYNFIKSHSSLSNLTPAEVCGINYSHREKINWFVKY